MTTLWAVVRDEEAADDSVRNLGCCIARSIGPQSNSYMRGGQFYMKCSESILLLTVTSWRPSEGGVSDAPTDR